MLNYLLFAAKVPNTLWSHSNSSYYDACCETEPRGRGLCARRGAQTGHEVVLRGKQGERQIDLHSEREMTC